MIVAKGTKRTHAAIVRAGLRDKDMPCTVSVESLGKCVAFLRGLGPYQHALAQAQQTVDTFDVVFGKKPGGSLQA